MSKSYLHWGEWLKSRWAFVGRKRLSSLTEEVGCSRRTLNNWMNAPTPPEKMEKRFDLSLAAALKTDREMLFVGWRLTKPQDAPIVEPIDERQRLILRLFKLTSFISVEDLRSLVASAETMHESVANKVLENMRRDGLIHGPPWAK
jgi:hypothetical protein